ncbi:restriction endonuclease subunit S [Caldibacillus thermoamylovorans]|uniref:restriction endonuclease subunit S n=1 Tax=Caldibacillus thermoamylovorans TaxID=35841 RepID=UPI002040D415|nr:restriction endonuclease subunit S [Caldibacillus thermoamylovorans]MCM3055822.1 restriction endonuclease subunit S [Caldibacillus thermoamylovorans]
MKFKYKKIKDIAVVYSGTTPSTSKSEYWNGNIKWITPAELQDGHNWYIYDTERKITDEAVRSKNLKMLKKGTILLTTRAPIGKVALVGEVMCTNQGFKNIECNTDVVNSEFLYFWLLSKKEYLNSLGRGATFKEISKTIVENIQVPVPPLGIQGKIVEILKQSLFLIDKRKAQIEVLDQLTQSVFLEMFGDPKLNKKNWKKQKLNDVCLRKGEYGSGSSAIPYDSGKPRYIRITDIRDDGSLNDDIVAPSNPDDYEKYRLNEGNILFARSGATVGKTYLHSEKNGYCIFAGYLIRFVPDTSKINPKFLFQFTRTQYYKQWVMSKQNTVAQPNINAKQYGEELFIICPPLELQNRFAKIVEEIEVEKELLQKSMVELQNNFNSLMKRAFKGELFND